VRDIIAAGRKLGEKSPSLTMSFPSSTFGVHGLVRSKRFLTSPTLSETPDYTQLTFRVKLPLAKCDSIRMLTAVRS
jgi:hypothetical protein